MRLADLMLEPILTAMLAAGVTGPQYALPPDLLPGAAAAPAPTGQAASPGQAGVFGAAELEARLRGLLDLAAQKAVEAGCPKEYADCADFAVCALIDELLLGSAWAGKKEWLRRPLQRARHSTATAGEDFYRILDELLDRADRLPSLAAKDGGEEKGAPAAKGEGEEKGALAALEVFALCLTQGFSGMHFNEPARVREYFERVRAVLPDLRAIPGADESSPLFCAPQRPERQWRATGEIGKLARRFDLLDALLWLAPPAALALLYRLYAERLGAMAETIFTGM